MCPVFPLSLYFSLIERAWSWLCPHMTLLCVLSWPLTFKEILLPHLPNSSKKESPINLYQNLSLSLFQMTMLEISKDRTRFCSSFPRQFLLKMESYSQRNCEPTAHYNKVTSGKNIRWSVIILLCGQTNDERVLKKVYFVSCRRE